MRRIDSNKIFAELANEMYYMFNVKCVQGESVNRLNSQALISLARFLNECKRARKVELVNFMVKPTLHFGWEEWNSGGGCMIWFVDYTTSDGKTHSLHMSDECLLHSNLPANEFIDLECWEDQECTFLSPPVYFDKYYRSVAPMLCQYTGQEQADILADDINTLFNWLNN